MKVGAGAEVPGADGVDQTYAVLRDMRMAQLFAHHGSIIRLNKDIIVGRPRLGLGQPYSRLAEQLCNLAVDVFRTVIRMEAKDNEREPIQ